jgi:hypothetical protein
MTRTIQIALAAMLTIATPLAGAGAAERSIERTGPAGGTVARSVTVEPGARERSVIYVGPEGRELERARGCAVGAGCSLSVEGPSGRAVSVVRDRDDLRPVAARHVRVVTPVRRAAPVVVVPRVAAPRVIVRPRPLVRRPLLRAIIRN